MSTGQCPGLKLHTYQLSQIQLSKKTVHSLLFDNVQALVYAGPGPLYAAHLVLPLLLLVHLPPVPTLLAFTTFLWFHPLHLL